MNFHLGDRRPDATADTAADAYAAHHHDDDRHENSLPDEGPQVGVALLDGVVEVVVPTEQASVRYVDVLGLGAASFER